ncbi:DUF1802 family protein [Nostoc sp. JL23]|uniref:DUF1802 family protein n=1 Tax=Nostoc sp. JL23 TaxID=2815394 RepID=UPI0025E0538B|nr:DUF1802 family protein [Nostoc sp. JL23]
MSNDLINVISKNNPFQGRLVVRDQNVWGQGFPDVPSLNSHASDAIYEAVEKVRSGQRKVVGITITAERGLGKSHVIGRIRHQLQVDGSALFVYMSQCNNLNRIKAEFLTTLANSLKQIGSQDVSQWQYLATALINEAFNKNYTAQQLINQFPGALVKNPKVVEVLRDKVLSIKPDLENPDIITAILWTLSPDPAYEIFAIRWLAGNSLPQVKADAMGLANVSADDKEAESFTTARQILNLIGDYKPIVVRQNIFLAYLRVYQLPKSIEVPIKSNSQFLALPQPLNVSETKPVLNDRTFAQRKHQLEKLEPPLHLELEELQSAIASLSISQPAAKQLDDDMKVFLGWSSEKLIKQPDPDLAWINNIAALGNRSKQEDEWKNNYQAGTDFENIVRDSLEFLGFTIDYAHKGGAGGLDLFCSKPYPLFGECKAGKKIPNPTAVQLLNLGTLRRSDLFNQATKLIIGPGQATTQLQDAAKVHNMAIINPETLEKLVKLQNNHRNSIDLFKLKEYLKAGQSDEEVEKYIDQVYKEMSLRSQIITAVKELSEQDNETSKATHHSFITEIRAHYNATHNPRLNDEVVRDLLIELSSPLTGYLGRIKGSDWKSDRFYFLRNLLIN